MGESSVRLRVAGSWSGTIDIPSLDEWTVSTLRSHLASLSAISADSIKLICAGKTLKDDPANNQTLREAGLSPNSKLLLTRSGAQQASSLIAEKERLDRLARLKAAADAMAKRSGEDVHGSDGFDIELENQSGEKIVLQSESDRRALMTGLMFHGKGRDLLAAKNYADALELFTMAEEAFSLCDSKFLELVDNVALLQIDMVWCYFMLKDIACLAIAGQRLAQARKGLKRSHGPDLQRLRVLQGGFSPELAIYVRLELLEGVVFFHNGQFEDARKALVSARMKFEKLQISDESVVCLAEMGFGTRESRRALRLASQDVAGAIEFLMEERRKEAKRKEDDKKHHQQRREQKHYGKTPLGKYVDLSKVDELASIGYERKLVAEALRNMENDREAALDILSDPIRNAVLQSALSKKETKSKQVDEAEIAELVSMGFSRSRALHALKASPGKAEALDMLLQGGSSSSIDEAASGSGSSNSAVDVDLDSESPPLATTSQESTQPSKENTRDAEMEDEIIEVLTGDSLQEYDIEVDKEGEAIHEYLNMLNDSQNPQAPN